jgi:hypothetical protein
LLRDPLLAIKNLPVLRLTGSLQPDKLLLALLRESLLYGAPFLLIGLILLVLLSALLPPDLFLLLPVDLVLLPLLNPLLLLDLLLLLLLRALLLSCSLLLLLLLRLRLLALLFFLLLLRLLLLSLLLALLLLLVLLCLSGQAHSRQHHHADHCRPDHSL